MKKDIYKHICVHTFKEHVQDQEAKLKMQKLRKYVDVSFSPLNHCPNFLLVIGNK